MKLISGVNAPALILVHCITNIPSSWLVLRWCCPCPWLRENVTPTINLIIVRLCRSPVRKFHNTMTATLHRTAATTAIHPICAVSPFVDVAKDTAFRRLIEMEPVCCGRTFIHILLRYCQMGVSGSHLLRSLGALKRSKGVVERKWKNVLVLLSYQLTFQPPSARNCSD